MRRTYVQVTVPDALLAKLDAFARQDRRFTRSDTIRVALERFFEEHPELCGTPQ